MTNPFADLIPMKLMAFLYNGHVLPDTTNIENGIMPPPPEGQWARPGTVDGPIGRFLLPLGGGSVEVAWKFYFLINIHALSGTTNIENAIMPPPRGAMGPARNRRRPNWPVPIAPRGGSAEGARKFYFLIKKLRPKIWNNWTLNFRCGQWLLLCMFMCISVMGCQKNTPPVSFYALTPMTTSDVSPGGQQTLKDVSIGIGPITFPQTLQRPQIVTRLSPNRLELSEFHRWGGDLKQDFLNIMVQNISMIMGSNQVFKYPWSPSFEPKYRVTLDVNQFDGRLGESVVLNSIWEIKQGKPGKEKTEIKRSIIEQPVSGDDYNALVEAKSKALKTLSIEITDKIRLQEK